MRLIEKVWFQSHPAKWLLVPLLLPLTVIFTVLSFLRRLAYQIGLIKQIKMSVPVVVVGNIGIGGNGKTPVTLYLVHKLTKQGIKVGVVSRGYGSKAPYYPYQVTKQSSAKQAGDEPLLIFQRSGVPVVIGADRVAGCQQLIDQGCQLIIADDGLQHYRLARDVEFIVVDGKRLFGNGLLLPAGPLRESKRRINKSDCVIVNGESQWQKPESKVTVPSLTMQLSAQQVVNVNSGERVALNTFLAEYLADNHQVNALAGIGDPQRFFTTLEQYGFSIVNAKGFVDHQAFSTQDLQAFASDIPLLMTEKDAVKCADFAQSNYWYLPVDAVFEKTNADESITAMVSKIAALASRTG
ncbi:MAG: tetraacyldisaccharide 4'-kinase [Cognaticolwellia sp.]